jgi:hypothetical protein
MTTWVVRLFGILKILTIERHPEKQKVVVLIIRAGEETPRGS